MLIYLHGFNSSDQSFKARLLKERYRALGRADEFICPNLPWRFRDALALIEREIRSQQQPVSLIGSSLGGYYAISMAERFGLPAILVNPAVNAWRSLSQHLGPQDNPYTGEPYLLDAGHIEELRALEVPAITRPERYFLLQAKGDEVLDWREAVAKFPASPQVLIEGGDHAFSNFADYLDPVIAFADQHAARP